jgi:hypothetical protein
LAVIADYSNIYKTDTSIFCCTSDRFEGFDRFEKFEEIEEIALVFYKTKQIHLPTTILITN